MRRAYPGLSRTAIGMLMLVAAAAWGCVERAGVKFGYVDTTILVSRYSEAIEAQSQIARQREDFVRNLRTLEEEAAQLRDAGSREALKPSGAGPAVTSQALAVKEAELERYRRAAQGKERQLEQETMRPVVERLNTEMRAFGKANGFTVIFGTLQGGNILYAEPAIDVTDQFLEHLESKRRLQGSGS